MKIKKFLKRLPVLVLSAIFISNCAFSTYAKAGAFLPLYNALQWSFEGFTSTQAVLRGCYSDRNPVYSSDYVGGIAPEGSCSNALDSFTDFVNHIPNIHNPASLIVSMLDTLQREGYIDTSTDTGALYKDWFENEYCNGYQTSVGSPIKATEIPFGGVDNINGMSFSLPIAVTDGLGGNPDAFVNRFSSLTWVAQNIFATSGYKIVGYVTFAPFTSYPNSGNGGYTIEHNFNTGQTKYCGIEFNLDWKKIDGKQTIVPSRMTKSGYNTTTAPDNMSSMLGSGYYYEDGIAYALTNNLVGYGEAGEDTEVKNRGDVLPNNLGIAKQLPAVADTNTEIWALPSPSQLPQPQRDDKGILKFPPLVIPPIGGGAPINIPVMQPNVNVYVDNRDYSTHTDITNYNEIYNDNSYNPQINYNIVNQYINEGAITYEQFMKALQEYFGVVVYNINDNRTYPYTQITNNEGDTIYQTINNYYNFDGGENILPPASLPPSILDRFPFSIPKYLGSFLLCLAAPPVTPEFDITKPEIQDGHAVFTTIHVTLHEWDNVALILRVLILALWTVCCFLVFHRWAKGH